MRRRPSISSLMILVGVIALNLAVIRSARGLLLPWEFPALLPFISLQLAALLALRHTSRPRAFWTGFLLGGLPLTASFLAGMFSPGDYGIDQDGNHIAIPGSASFELWHSYTETPRTSSNLASGPSTPSSSNPSKPATFSASFSGSFPSSSPPSSEVFSPSGSSASADLRRIWIPPYLLPLPKHADPVEL